MQQAIYRKTVERAAGPRRQALARPAVARPSLRHRIARQWDLWGVLALMGSSAAYGVYALLHLA